MDSLAEIKEINEEENLVESLGLRPGKAKLVLSRIAKWEGSSSSADPKPAAAKRKAAAPAPKPAAKPKAKAAAKPASKRKRAQDDESDSSDSSEGFAQGQQRYRAQGDSLCYPPESF